MADRGRAPRDRRSDLHRRRHPHRLFALTPQGGPRGSASPQTTSSSSAQFRGPNCRHCYLLFGGTRFVVEENELHVQVFHHHVARRFVIAAVLCFVSALVIVPAPAFSLQVVHSPWFPALALRTVLGGFLSDPPRHGEQLVTPILSESKQVHAQQERIAVSFAGRKYVGRCIRGIHALGDLLRFHPPLGGYRDLEDAVAGC